MCLCTVLTRYNDEYLTDISNLKLLDDDFSNIIFEDQDCLELLLETVLNRKIDIIEYHTQHSIKNLFGRSIRIDIFAKTREGHLINIEIQNDDAGASPKRARYHGSLIDTKESFKSEKWSEIPKMIVIFITKNDVLGEELPIYHMQRVSKETQDVFKDEEEIIYVNASIQDDTPLGRLMHDFQCTKVEDMYYEVLRERVRYFKENEEGVRKMCQIMEDIKKRGVVEGEVRSRVIDLKMLMINCNFTLEKALDALGIPFDEREMYIKKLAM